MEQNTLYRKYRPLDFDAVVGQDAIVKTLKNQIQNDRVAHAYLFCGTRGTGKTTVAKILARAVNCQNRKDANPCNSCESCKSSIEGTNLNVYEIDAATNNSIDDIRNIKEIVEYPPINNEKYKVFIIDEAQELSDAARDAFLKTLEEPPSYVIFILATTEPNKFKSTILSRCQRYDFRRISVDEIVENLSNICDKEKIEVEKESLYFIANLGDGSMRESISILDRCQSFLSGEKLTLDEVKKILGVADETVFKNLVISIEQSDITSVIVILDELIKKGKELNIFINDFIWYMRNLLIIKEINEPNETLSITKEKFEALKDLSNKIPKDTIIWYIKKLSECANVIKTADNKRVIIETTLIKLASPESDYIEEAVMSRLKSLEEKLEGKSFIKVFDEGSREEKENLKNEIENRDVAIKEETQETDKKKIEISPTTFDDFKIIKTKWNQIISTVERFKKAMLKTAKILPAKKEGIIEIIVENDIGVEILSSEELIKEIEKNIKDIVNKEYRIQIKNKEKEIIDEDVDKMIEEMFDTQVEVEGRE